MRTSELIKYYSQEKFREFMLNYSKNREVIPRFRERFGERPQTFRFDGELMNVIRMGVSSFHASEEHWRNPLSLSKDLSINELNNQRLKWDLILDIDTKKLEYAKECAKLIIDALRFHDINKISIKFSGGTGFHIGVSFKNFKINGEEISKQYPSALKIVSSYLNELIREPLSDKIGPNPFNKVSIDPVAIAPRHLIRAPYSFNEKKWLISVPINPNNINEFNINDAIPTRVEFNEGFLNEECDATELFTQAFDWIKKEEKKKSRKIVVKKKVSEQNYPPCIQNILKGLSDGKKRALFILINFYHQTKHDWDSIEELVIKWNQNNNPQLSTNYIKSQINWAKKQGGLMPPNCANGVYKEINVCSPDNLCKKISNPVSYALRKNKYRKI